jgi:hypothetical protein
MVSAYATSVKLFALLTAAVGDADAPVTLNYGTSRDPRRVLLAVIEETSRHAGHADTIGEQIDAQTGRADSHARPDNTPPTPPRLGTTRARKFARGDAV